MCRYWRSILNISLIGISGQFLRINSDDSHIPISGKQRITSIYVLKRERQATSKETATYDLKVIYVRYLPNRAVTTSWGLFLHPTPTPHPHNVRD